LVQVCEEVTVTSAENEAGAELERVLTELVLAVSSGAGASTCSGVVAAEKVEQVPGFQRGCSVGGPVGVDEQRKGNAGFLAKQRSVTQVAETDGGERSAGLMEFLFVFTQLRDKLAAEDSAVVTQEDHDGGSTFPERAEAKVGAAGFG
jgi:hypothetical protein